MDDADIEEMFAGLGPVAIRRMFGGKGVYHHGLIVAVDLGGGMLLKADAASAPAFQAAGAVRWTYAGRKGKPVQMPYWSVPDDAWDDPERMAGWVRLAYEAALRSSDGRAKAPSRAKRVPRGAAGRAWPSLPYADWADTCETLHLWCQVVGKVRLARTPWLNHSWQTPLYVSARGLATGLIPHGRRAFDLEFDFVDSVLIVRTDGGEARIGLEPMSVAAFHAKAMAALAELGVPVAIDGAPNEMAVAIPFAKDLAPRAYDPAAAARFWRVLLAADRVLKTFRTGFLGKASPVHFFWGSFDLAATRFSGRPAPRHPGGVPHLPDAVAREAYSHEVSSAGFWPGGPGDQDAAFYAYAWPEPAGFREAAVAPAAARYEEALGEFVLPYEAVRTAADPEGALMDFLASTYAAAADLGHWDRAGLECELGAPGRPRAT